ncbi:winged helix-turn-helix domain-containing protein [Thermococcus litoralis]|uniref:winged helix-turn-helix domain-containing protein n=1 Tax=Thermococcus litoralis TaxID=2265 RepID=UPI000B351E93|nr:helix-turn-helix domain-containing protein [Thermococcus litoralis]
MRAPIIKEKILRELAVKGETSVKELLAKFDINRPYLYRVLRSLEERGAIVLETGRIQVVDKKSLLYAWGMEKKRILQVIRGVTYKVRPKEVMDFVVFSGTAALWLMGRVLEPSFGTAYIKKEDFDKLRRIGTKREGYPIKFYSYDEDIFNYITEVRGYKVPIIEQVIVDAWGEGIYTRVIDELLEEMENGRGSSEDLG